MLGGIGAFAAFVRVPSGYAEPVLVSSTDGVGTKLKVAFLADRHDTVGIDLVAMGVNDVARARRRAALLPRLHRHRAARSGARRDAGGAGWPRAAGRPAARSSAARRPSCPISTRRASTTWPGFAVGIVERARIIDGAAVQPGDVVLGLASSGLHSNGFSLVRRIVFDVMRLSIERRCPGRGARSRDVLLEPTRIYVRSILRVRDDVTAHGPHHGGGLTGNLPRVLPGGLPGARAPVGLAAPPPVFRALQAAGAGRRGRDVPDLQHGHRLRRGRAARGRRCPPRGSTAAGEAVFAIGEIVRASAAWS